MKVVIFTRTGFHHTSFINRLQERFDVSCVVREAYPDMHMEGRFRALMKNVLRRNCRQEIKDGRYLDGFNKNFSAGFRYHRMLKDFLKAPFDVVVERKGTKYLNVKCGDINSMDFSSFLKGLGPDIVAVLGSSVILPRVISVPTAGMVNLHSGLSPYYRGTWSYGWPIVNEEPECIGATVHHIDPGIDTGDIIYQTRPVLDGRDDLNTIFLKVIAEGIELAGDAVDEMVRKGTAASYKQPEKTGRVYRTKDFNADAARSCISSIEGGVIDRYNEDKQSADARVPLLGYVPPRLFR